MEHKGLSVNRLQDNPLEKAFAETWEEYNGQFNQLAYMLSEDNKLDWENVSDRDAQIAATVIQWLGSNVGQAFVRDVMENPEGRYDDLGLKNPLKKYNFWHEDKR